MEERLQKIIVGEGEGESKAFLNVISFTSFSYVQEGK